MGKNLTLDASVDFFTPLLEAWRIEPAGPIEELVNGQVFRIPASGGYSLILKNVGENHPQKMRRLVFEHEVLLHVSEAGLPVAVPLLDRAGSEAVPWRQRLYTLTPDLQNYPQETYQYTRSKLFKNYGKAIARMHQALETFPKNNLAEKTWRNDLAEEVFVKGLPLLKNSPNPTMAKVAEMMSGDLHTEMEAAYACLPDQLIHRDCHRGNLLTCKHEVTGIIDWDHLSIGPRLLDVAYFATSEVHRRLQERDIMAHWHKELAWLLQGYHKEEPFSELEKNAFPAILLAIPFLFINWLVSINRDYWIQVEVLAWLANNLEEVQATLGKLAPDISATLVSRKNL